MEILCQQEKNIPLMSSTNNLNEIEKKIKSVLDAITSDTKMMNENENLNTTTIKSGIYLIINKINKKWYVGSSNDINTRWYEHIRTLRHNRHCNDYLQRAWNKDGELNFLFMVLEIIPAYNLLITEQKYLDYGKTIQDSVYNLKFSVSNGEGIMSEYSKKKLSNSIKGHIISQKTKEKISNALKGNVVNENTKLKISKTLKGRKYSKERCEAIRQGKLKKFQNVEYKNKVYAFTQTDEYKQKMSEINNTRYSINSFQP
jgi:group I intron endonuclease